MTILGMGGETLHTNNMWSHRQGNVESTALEIQVNWLHEVRNVR